LKAPPVDALEVAPGADTSEVVVLLAAALPTRLQVVGLIIAAGAHGTQATEALAGVDVSVGNPRRKRVLPGVDQGDAEEPDEAGLLGSEPLMHPFEPPVVPGRLRTNPQP
jgi:hypothetical protein